MRRFLVVLAIVCVWVGLGSPAYAKGPIGATLAGPGLAATVRLGSNSDGTIPLALDQLAQGTRLFDLQSPNTAVAANAPTGELGAKYVVTYDFGCHVVAGTDSCGSIPRRAEVHQDVYPFAVTGPQVYVAPGQTLYGTPLRSGWVPAGRTLTPTLLTLGVPSPATASRSASRQAMTQPDAETSSHTALTWPSIAAVGAVLIAASGLAFVVMRKRRLGRIS